MKKYSRKELRRLEKKMQDRRNWEDADHTVSFKGPTSIRFPEETLRKLHAIAQIRQMPINRLVNEYVKPFAEGEYAILQRLR